MLHLLQLEWMKLRQYRLFIILVVIYMISMPGIFASAMNAEIDELSGTMKSIYMFPGVWQYLGYLGNWMTFFCFGFLGVTLVTMEYSNKTLRQNIMTGMSRKTFYWSKIYVMAAISFFATLYFVIIGLVYGFMNTDYIMTSRVMVGFELAPRYWLMCFGYMVFAFFLGLLIRRSGIAIFLYFSYVLFGELILRYLVHTKLFGFNNAMNYYPLNAMEDLVPVPLPIMFNGVLERANDMGYNFFLTPWQAIITSSIYIALFLGLGYWAFQRRDL